MCHRSAGLCPHCGCCDTLLISQVHGVRAVQPLRASLAGLLGTVYVHVRVDRRAIGCRGCGRSSVITA